MRAQEEVLERRNSLREDLADDLPSEVEGQLEAQKAILNWILEGDVMPAEYVIEGKLKLSGELFEEVVIGGLDGDGRLYRSGSCDQAGEYVLARRPSPQEWDEKKKM